MGDTSVWDVLAAIGTVAKDVASIVALVAILVKPIRERLFGAAAVREGQKCLLRSEILRTYYRNEDRETLRQYEYENMTHCYKAYKALGGNSFVDHIHAKMDKWDVHP